MTELRAFARDMFDLLIVYVIGVVSAFGWTLFGFYVYLNPLPADSPLGTDFNKDIGTALVSQGLIFGVTFIVAGIIRLLRNNREQEELKRDRQMIREIHAWMLEMQDDNRLPPPTEVSKQLKTNGAKPKKARRRR